MFKVAIIGGAETNDYNKFKERCIFFLRNKAKSGCGITILSTGDEYVDKFAKSYNITVQTFYTEWRRFGKDALKMRNHSICSDCNALIYFNAGVKDHEMLYKMAKDKEIPCRVILP